MTKTIGGALARLLGVTILAASLGACAFLNTVKNPVTRTQLVEIESAYGVALAAAVGYRSACARKAIPPTCRPIVAKLQQADRVVEVSITALRRFVRNYPDLNSPDLVQAAWQAVEDFKAVSATAGL